jgi:hypothetical protein
VGVGFTLLRSKRGSSTSRAHHSLGSECEEKAWARCGRNDSFLGADSVKCWGRVLKRAGKCGCREGGSDEVVGGMDYGVKAAQERRNPN